MQAAKKAIPPNTEESRYDLSTRAADYPDWEAGKPLRTFVLCSHTRSGSTLLSEAMYEAGGMGCPVEYFHAGFEPTLSHMWGAVDLNSYIREIYRYRTDPSGALGIKMFWMDVLALCRNRHPEESDAINAELEEQPEATARLNDLARRVFEEIFPAPHYIFLTRRDRLRHAISSMISGQVKIFRDISGFERPAAVGEPTYDYESILNRIRYFAYCDSRWNEFFQGAGIQPHRVFYEDLCSDYEGTVRDLLVSAGLWHSGKKISRPRLKRQTNRTSEEFAMRFLQEHARKGCEGGILQPQSLEKHFRYRTNE